MKSRKTIIWCLLFLVSGAAAVFLACDNTIPIEYNFLFLLPMALVFALVIIAPVTDIVFSRISTIIVFFVYFLRTVIIPVIMRLGQYETLINITRYRTYSFQAIILIVYEVLTVFVFIRIKASKLIEDESLINSREIHFNNSFSKRNRSLFIFVLSSFVAYVVIMLIRDPAIIRSNFVFLVGTPDDWKMEANYVALGDDNASGTLGILVTFMNQVLSFITVFVPPLLVQRISKNSSVSKYILFFFIIGVIAIVGTEERFRSIDYSLALIFTINALDNRQYKKFTNVLIVGITAIAFFGLIQKSYAGNADYSMRQLSSTFSAYFSSVPGVAASIPFSQSLGSLNLFRLPTDIIAMIPYLKSMLSGILPINTGRMYNYYLTGTSRSIGQIIPSIGLGYVYFGFILSPIIPIISVSFSMSFEKQARRSTDVVYKNLFYAAAIMLARCCGQCSFLQCVSSLCNIGIMYMLPRLFLGRSSIMRREETHEKQ